MTVESMEEAIHTDKHTVIHHTKPKGQNSVHRMTTVGLHETLHTKLSSFWGGRGRRGSKPVLKPQPSQ